MLFACEGQLKKGANAVCSAYGGILWWWGKEVKRYTDMGYHGVLFERDLTVRMTDDRDEYSIIWALMRRLCK